MSNNTLQKTKNDLAISFTEEDLKEIDASYQTINLADSAALIEYGADVQKKLSEISARMLANLNSQDIDNIGEVLNTTVSYLRDIEDEKGKFALFKKTKEISLREKYKEAEKNVDKVSVTLQQHQIQLMKNSAMLSHLYQMNNAYFHELSMKIAAGKKKLADCKQNLLPVLEKKATETNLAQDAQALADMKNQMDRFEKKLHELELSSSISLQAAPLIRLLQSNQSSMAEKIQSTLLNTIPLWKNQVIFALSMEHTKQVSKEEKKISDMTNRLLTENTDSVNLASVKVMKSAKNTLIDNLSLDATNKLLIESLDEMARIRQEGLENQHTIKLEFGGAEVTSAE